MFVTCGLDLGCRFNYILQEECYQRAVIQGWLVWFVHHFISNQHKELYELETDVSRCFALVKWLATVTAMTVRGLCLSSGSQGFVSGKCLGEWLVQKSLAAETKG